MSRFLLDEEMRERLWLRTGRDFLIVKPANASTATTARITEVGPENDRLRERIVDLLLECVSLIEKLLKPKGHR